MPGLVTLTGGTGFIGHVLLENFLRRGWRVRALTRRPDRPARERLEWIPGDLDDIPALQQLTRGSDAVVHCAGVVRGASEQTFMNSNLEGTRHILAAAAAQVPPPRFLLISSLAAREPQLSWYAHSKRQAEDVLRKEAGSMQWTVLRPGAVYGPGDREMRPLLKAMQNGILVLPGCPGARFGLLHVQDLADAVCAWLGSNPPGQSVFELDDGTPGGYGADSLARIAESIRGRRIVQVNIPAMVLRAVAHVNLHCARLFGYAPMLTPGKVRELLHPDWVCDNRPLNQALSWSPRIRLADALLDKALFPA